MVRIHLGPQEKSEPLTIPVERFVSMLRFDSKGKMGYSCPQNQATAVFGTSKNHNPESRLKQQNCS